jgi:hypothetical protein
MTAESKFVVQKLLDLSGTIRSFCDTASQLSKTIF